MHTFCTSEMSQKFAVGSRIIPGNLKCLLYVYSTVISVHSGSVIAFFVAQLALSLVSELSVQFSSVISLAGFV